MAVTYTFTAKQAPAMFAQQGRALKAAVVRGLRRGAQRGLVEMGIRIKQVRPFPPVNTGQYQRAWRVYSTPNGAVLVNDSPYAAIIELGRRPGAKPPPISIIREWVYRKFRVERKWKGGRIRNADTARAQYAEIESIAWAIAKAIGKRGLKPKHIMTGAQPKLAEMAEQEIERSLAEADGRA